MALGGPPPRMKGLSLVRRVAATRGLSVRHQAESSPLWGRDVWCLMVVVCRWESFSSAIELSAQKDAMVKTPCC